MAGSMHYMHCMHGSGTLRRDRDVPESVEDLMHTDPPGCKGRVVDGIKS